MSNAVPIFISRGAEVLSSLLNYVNEEDSEIEFTAELLRRVKLGKTTDEDFEQVRISWVIKLI